MPLRPGAALLTSFIATQAWATNPPTLKVEAGELASHGQSDRARLRRLVAWRKGDVCIGRYDLSSALLEVKQVRSGVVGALRSPSSQRLGLLDIELLDDAVEAAAAVDFRVPAGEWTFVVAPDGTPVVSRVQDTPMVKATGDAVHDRVKAIRAGLRSGDASEQLTALRAFQETRCFGLISDALALADSQTDVTDPQGMRARLADGSERLGPRRTTLGVEARMAVWVVSNALRDEASPSPSDPAARWQAWWKEILATELKPATTR